MKQSVSEESTMNFPREEYASLKNETEKPDSVKVQNEQEESTCVNKQGWYCTCMIG